MQYLASFIDSASKDELKLILVEVERRLAAMGEVTPLRSPGSASVEVPDDTKHLSEAELIQATESFSRWCASAKTPMQRRSRSRLWLAFLLIRHGGLRLGEVLAIDDTTDFIFERREVLVGGAHARTVLLAAPVMEEIHALLASPMMYSLRGQVLALDQGYLRRKFYERAKECGLSPSLFNPRIIRHSRAIELLRGGAPLQVVQTYLGLLSSNAGANYLEFTEEAAKRIVQRHINLEVKMKTSARNAFTGRITHITRDGLLVEVELSTMSGLQVVAVITEDSFNNLRLAEGSAVTATVKAPWVVLEEKSKNYKSSTRNKFTGKVTRVKKSDIACEVLVDLDEGSKACALVTLESVENLGLKPGKPITVMFKAFSVILNVE